jgi:hypothetical protein
MTDYHPLILRAIEGLDRNTGEARRALYERARNALLTQLRSIKPALSEAEITRERLALEEAVRKVEAEAARKLRAGNTPPRSVEPEPPKSDWTWDEPPQRSSGGQTSTAEARPARPDRPDRPAFMPARPPLAGEGLKGFRDVVAEAETLGGATAHASRAAREAYASVPTDTPELDRLEPRAEPEGFRTSRDYGDQRSPGTMPQDERPAPTYAADTAYPDRPPLADNEPRSRASGPLPRRPEAAELDEHAVRARKGMMAAIAAIVVILVLAGAAYLQRDRIAALLGGAKTATQQSPRDPSQARPKITDRVGQDGQVDSAARTGPGTQGAPTAVVAQRAVLYEEDPQNPEGNRYVGSALWRTETVSPGPGLAPELAIRADVEIPERRLAMTLSIRRNTDQALPASHTIEILFNLPADFAFGGVSNVPGILMKEAEQTRGAPLSGLAVKVTNNFFLVGLSAAEVDVTRNLQVLKDRAWFDIPIVYNNGRRAILAIEKGNPGDRVFAEAFRAWGR